MSDDPLSAVEADHAMSGLGRTAVIVYRGARSEAVNTWEAVMATTAFLIAMLAKPNPTDLS